MVQQINLLTRRKSRKDVLTLAWIGFGLLFVMLVIFAGLTEWRLQQHRKLETQAQGVLADLKVTLEKKRQDAGLADSEAMAKEAASLRSQIDTRRDWVELLQKGELGNPAGYSQWLRTLATVHVDGVWLQGVDIGKGGQTMSIQGKSMDAEAVMIYIEQVNAAFKPMNIRFTAMEISQDAQTVEGASAHRTPPLSFKIF